MSESVSPRKTSRPKMPDDYGIPENNDALLPWSYVEDRLKAARNYWIATVGAKGAPAVTPVWGVWVDGKVFFDGSPLTRRGRNIAKNPHVVVHLESGDQVVILEGRARIYTSAPEPSLAGRVAEAYRQKYAADGYSPTAEQWNEGGLFVFEPDTALGWTKFPEDVTRWALK